MEPCNSNYNKAIQSNTPISSRAPFENKHVPPVFNFPTSVKDASTQTDEKMYHCALQNFPFLCHHCSTRFKNKVDLSKHMTAHLRAQVILCHLCPVSFTSERNFKRHMRYVHTDEKNFLCSQCPLAFKRKHTLQRHSREVHQVCNDEKLFSCSECPVNSTQEISLHESPSVLCVQDERAVFGGISSNSSKKERHLQDNMREEILMKMKRSFLDKKRKKTNNRKIFSCNKCSVKFKFKTNLRSHLFRVHSVNQNFSCNHCSKQFKSKRDLRKHIFTHETENPYSCSHRSVEVYHKDHLRTHMTLHAQETSPHHSPSPKKYKTKRLKEKYLENKLKDLKPNMYSPIKVKPSESPMKKCILIEAESTHACKLCSVSYREVKDLREHLAATHSKNASSI